MRVRELPPLRLSAGIVTPNGRSYRWAADEPRAENVLGDLVFSSTLPGGFEQCSSKLARLPSRDYADLERLSTLTVYGPGGDIRGEYRLEDVPRASGDQFAITPQAVGWQAALDDNAEARMIYVDRDLSAWGPPSRTRQIVMIGAPRVTGDADVAPDPSGLPSFFQYITGAWGGIAQDERYYDAGPGVTIDAIYYDFEPTSNVNPADANWHWTIGASTDDALGGAVGSANLRAASGAGYYAPGAGKRFANLTLIYGAAGGSSGQKYGINWRKLAVYGNHGLARRAVSGEPGLSAVDPGGFLCSDIEAHAIGKWAPALKFTTGADGSIQPSTFVIVHLVFKDLTTVSNIIKQATRFELRDWAVWENLTYYSNDRGARGRKWRTRVGPAQLQETGPQIARLFNAVIVSYQDVSGVTKTAGPPGSGCDTEDASLADTDPQNPCNQRGIVRCQPLSIGISTAAGAVGYGNRYWQELKAADNSGQAQLVGYVEDDRGVIHAASEVRAGDQIVFVDAHDPTSYRRIVRAEYTDSTKTCAISLDAPPDSMQALLERYNEVLVPLGIGA